MYRTQFSPTCRLITLGSSHFVPWNAWYTFNRDTPSRHGHAVDDFYFQQVTSSSPLKGLIGSGKRGTFRRLSVTKDHCVGNAREIKSPRQPGPVAWCRTRPSSFAKNAQDFGCGLPLPTPSKTQNPASWGPGFAHTRNAPQVYRLPVATAPARS
jgi:hypothetical protein